MMIKYGVLYTTHCCAANYFKNDRYDKDLNYRHTLDVRVSVVVCVQARFLFVNSDMSNNETICPGKQTVYDQM